MKRYHPALMALRLALRLMTKHPEGADIGSPLLNKSAWWAHILLYLLVFAMVITGLATANTAGLPDIIFFGSGGALPVNFNDIFAHSVHKGLSVVLILVIAGHILAALYHQFVRKDGLLARMWFGKRT